MSPNEKRNYHPADRLHVSSQAYSEKHVKNIAARLAERNSATIPHRSYWVQDDFANWITTNFQRDQIAECEQIVRASYPYGERQSTRRALYGLGRSKQPRSRTIHTP